MKLTPDGDHQTLFLFFPSMAVKLACLLDVEKDEQHEEVRLCVI